LTTDHWHEEWAANRLAVAYSREHCQDALDFGLLIASRVLARFPEALDPAAQHILDTCHEDRSGERESYGMELRPMAAVTLEMVRRLAAERPDLASSVRELLVADEVAAIDAA
jgi:hypothetical protein